jgi:hypothetical protein
MNNNIRPSATTVSGLLENLLHYSNEIDNTILIGEQLAMVNEAGELYNELHGLVTPDYFTDVEYEWLVHLGNRWNELVRQYKNAMGENLPQPSQDILEELEDKLRDALDEFMGGGEDNYNV